MHVGDKKVPDRCDVLARFQFSPLTDDKLSDMINAYWQCSFMSRQSRWEILSRHAGIKEDAWEEWGASSNGDVVAFIDKSSVTDHSGNQYQCTVRRVDCDMLWERSSQYPLRCKSCQSLRSTRFAHWSLIKVMSDSHTSASSHTRYWDLIYSSWEGRENEKSSSCSKRLKLEGEVITSRSWQSSRKPVCVFKIMMLLLYHISQKWAHAVVEDRFPLNSPCSGHCSIVTVLYYFSYVCMWFMSI